MRYAIDSSTRRVGGGRVIIGGSPLKLFRLTPTGSMLFDRVERGDSIEPSRVNLSLLDRLVDAGAIHPTPDASDHDLGVTVVIPAYCVDAAALHTLVEQCAAADSIVIVDDASPIAITDVVGALVVRRDANGGPGAARDTGLAEVTTPLVAFVDTDVTLPAGWLPPLIRHFGDERVALVAPRVVSADHDDLISRYESQRSPLDLGPEAARVRAGSRVSYVPTAVAVCRVSALRKVGGFDPSMRIGEDVDLVWRLDEALLRVRYEPAVTAVHRPRSTMRAWLRQRYDYGSSAAQLARRHPGALAPVRVSGWSAASWVAVVAGWPVVGAAIAAVTTAMLARKLRDIPDGPRESLRLAGLGHLYAGRSIAAGITRAWWPIATIAALVSKRARRALLLAALVPPTIDWMRTRPPVNLPAYVALRILDDAAYGAGVARGVVAERSIDALVPDLTSWPKTRMRRGPGVVTQSSATTTADAR